MALIPQSKRQFVERVLRHLANNFPNAEFGISENEVLLYVDSALAAAITNTIMNGAKITGIKETPEAFIVSTTLGALTQNASTLEWYASLPQPPLSLPLGTSVTNVCFSNGAMIPLIKSKRTAYRSFLPTIPGTTARIMGGTIYLKTYDGGSLYGESIEVEMIQNRTSDLDAEMNVADDVMDAVFSLVITRCLQRFGVPQDIIKDNLPPGSKAS